MAQKPPALLDLSITLEEDPDPPTRRAFAGPDRAHVVTVLDRQPVWLVIRDRTESIVGGLHATTCGRWFLVTRLELEHSYWRMGLGAKLLGDAECIARKRHCTAIYLDTTSLQSSESCTRLGFRALRLQDDNPLGLGHGWLHKTLPVNAANDMASLADNGVGG